MSKLTKKCVLYNKYECKQCGKQVYAFNIDTENEVCKHMLKKHICWECAYWELFLKAPPDNIEVIDGKCYEIYPLVPKPQSNDILGGNGTRYILRKNGTILKSNDIWCLNAVPYKYQAKLPNTAWWASKRVYDKLLRSSHQCIAQGCLDRYHCYRYKYQMEFTKGPYNKVPLDWIVGDEHCPAFVPLREIKHYDEYVSASDIIDESSVSSKFKTL